MSVCILYTAAFVTTGRANKQVYTYASCILTVSATLHCTSECPVNTRQPPQSRFLFFTGRLGGRQEEVVVEPPGRGGYSNLQNDVKYMNGIAYHLLHKRENRRPAVVVQITAHNHTQQQCVFLYEFDAAPTVNIQFWRQQKTILSTTRCPSSSQKKSKLMYTTPEVFFCSSYWCLSCNHGLTILDMS